MMRSPSSLIRPALIARGRVVLRALLAFGLLAGAVPDRARAADDTLDRRVHTARLVRVDGVLPAGRDDERVVVRVRRGAAKDEKDTKKKKAPAKKPRGKSAPKKSTTKKEKSEEPVAVKRGIDVSEAWRGETQVFSADRLEKLEPILRGSGCQDAKGGCLYLENGRPGSEASFAFRLIPWKVSGHRAYLVQNDRCGAGGCDQGLFVAIDGQWRLLLEGFGMLERGRSSTQGFSDLTFRPRGHPPVKLVWDGRAYREAVEN
jgi:hypothetical protein